jgi:hypothetical protein
MSCSGHITLQVFLTIKTPAFKCATSVDASLGTVHVGWGMIHIRFRGKQNMYRTREIAHACFTTNKIVNWNLGHDEETWDTPKGRSLSLSAGEMTSCEQI